MRLVLGSGRSGTTWLLDALAAANGLRPIFEPLHPDAAGAIGRRYANRYLDRSSEAADLREHLLRLDRGEHRSLWTDYRFRRDKLFRDPQGRFAPLAPRYRLRTLAHNFRAHHPQTRLPGVLIKCIRASLMTDWLGERLGARMLFVMRHPCAVLDSKSRLRRAWDPQPTLARYRADRGLAAVLPEGYRRLLGAELAPVAAHTLLWCLENALPLELGLHPSCRLAFFEELAASDAAVAWRQAAASLELDGVPTAERLRRPSTMSSSRWASVPGPTNVRHGWRARLSAQAVEDVQAVLAALGCTLYCVDDDAPQRAA